MVQVLCGLGLVVDGPHRGELGWGEVAVCGVGSVHVVVDPPVLDDHSGFEQRIELPAVEQFVAQLAVERLDPCVLPRRPGVDEHRVDTVEAAPVGDRVSNELGPVVEPDKPALRVEGWGRVMRVLLG